MTAFNWDSEIENDGGDFVLLEPGVYPFTVKSLEKSFHNGGGKIPPCPKAVLTLRVGEGANVSDVNDGILLDDSLEWKICQFFKAIGARGHGEKYRMDWDSVEGRSGYLEISHRDYTTQDGEKRTANQVKKYIDPADVKPAKTAAW